jgi:hypothetical protein
MPGDLEFAPRGASHPFRLKMSAATVRQRSDDTDLKLFVMAFTAFFVCFYTLIM